jgi:predicted thioesterase
MKNPFQSGDTKQLTFQVTRDKLAKFETGVVHEVYGTFALGQDAEWTCRQFVLEMKEEGEEGIGTFLTVEHLSPAPLGCEVVITATFLEIKDKEIICSYEAHHKERLLAKGRTGQKILNKARFDAFLAKLKSEI